MKAPLLALFRLASLQIEELAIRFLFRGQFLDRILLGRARRVIEPEVPAIQYYAQGPPTPVEPRL